MTESAPYRQAVTRWYKSARWYRLRKHQLMLQPFCAMCLDNNTVTLATVVDHVIPHKGDPNSFWLGRLQSLCLPHHNKTKLEMESKGYATDIGMDGFPSDPDHPFNVVSRK